MLMMRSLGTAKSISLLMRPSYQTLSKAFSTSRRIAAVFFLRLRLREMSSMTLRSWVDVLCELLKPCWSGRILEVVWVLSLMSKCFSRTLDIVLMLLRRCDRVIYRVTYRIVNHGCAAVRIRAYCWYGLPHYLRSFGVMVMGRVLLISS